MRALVPPLLLLALIPLGACSRTHFPVGRSWLADDGGIVLGPALRSPGGDVTLSVQVQRRRPFTDEMIRSVDATVEGRVVLLRVRGSPIGPRWPPWDEQPLVLGDLPAGRYDVVLLEPSGNRSPVGRIDVPD